MIGVFHIIRDLRWDDLWLNGVDFRIHSKTGTVPFSLAHPHNIPNKSGSASNSLRIVLHVFFHIIANVLASPPRSLFSATTLPAFPACFVDCLGLCFVATMCFPVEGCLSDRILDSLSPLTSSSSLSFSSSSSYLSFFSSSSLSYSFPLPPSQVSAPCNGEP